MLSSDRPSAAKSHASAIDLLRPPVKIGSAVSSSGVLSAAAPPSSKPKDACTQAPLPQAPSTQRAQCDGPTS